MQAEGSTLSQAPKTRESVIGYGFNTGASRDSPIELDSPMSNIRTSSPKGPNFISMRNLARNIDIPSGSSDQTNEVTNGASETNTTTTIRDLQRTTAFLTRTRPVLPPLHWYGIRHALSLHDPERQASNNRNSQPTDSSSNDPDSTAAENQASREELEAVKSISNTSSDGVKPCNHTKRFNEKHRHEL